MADPTFQIRVEPGHTHPEKRGGSQNKSFWPFSPQFGLKIRRGPTPPRAPPLDPPLIIIIAITILLLLLIMMMMI